MSVVYMLVTHVMSQSALYTYKKTQVSPPSLVIMPLETILMAAMLLFKEKRWALQPIDWRRSRVAPLLWRCKIHNGAAAQCGGTSFTLSLRHPLSGSWGEQEETAIPEEDRGVM